MIYKDRGGFYIKEREGRDYYNNYVSTDNVYWLERYYRQSKSIIGLRRLVVTAQCTSKQEAEPYTFIIYSRADNESDMNEDYILPHGNNNNCYSQRPYYKTSKAVLDEQDQLLTSGMRAQEVYDKLLDKSGGPWQASSQSSEPRDVKQVLNRKSKLQSRKDDSKENKDSRERSDEIIAMINAQKDLSIIKGVLSSPTAYYFILHTEEQIQDILMFCCKDPAAVLGTDITFGLCNLWVTDTSYRNKRLLNPQRGKHPVFLGPSISPRGIWYLAVLQLNYWQPTLH